MQVDLEKIKAMAQQAVINGPQDEAHYASDQFDREAWHAQLIALAHEVPPAVVLAMIGQFGLLSAQLEAARKQPTTTPRDAYQAWEPTGNPVAGINGKLAARAGFDAGWLAGWQEAQRHNSIVEQTEQVSSAWLAQLRSEFIERSHRCDTLSAQISAMAAERDDLFGAYADTLAPFVRLMRMELQANSHKGDRAGWLTMTSEKAMREVEHHVCKLNNARMYAWDDEIVEHAADVANCCMMLLDVLGLLQVPAKGYSTSMDDVPDFTPGSGNRARRRAEALGITIPKAGEQP